MSVQLRVAEPRKKDSSRSKPKVNLPSPQLGATVSSPSTTVLHSRIQSQHIPHESRAYSAHTFDVSQANATSQGVAPMVEPKIQVLLPSSPVRQHPANHSEQPAAYDGSSSAQTQQRPLDGMERQVRNMILSNVLPPGHQRTPSSNTSRPAPSSQLQNPQSQGQGNRRRPNQAQRKQQAQQVHIPLQNPTAMPNLMSTHQAYSQYHGPGRVKGHLVAHQQSTMNLPQHNAYQRWPTGAALQPQALFNPHALPNPGLHNHQIGGPHPSVQFVDIPTQVNYLDQLARRKIPEVQMSPEECAEKQILKDHLNQICRKVVCDHELQFNAEFPTESVELKSFGSLSIGFATKDSDMDLVLMSPKSTPSLSAPESEIPAKVEEALMELGCGARLLTKTRVPIIKFCEKPGPELAAHLRLTRLWWEKERALGLPQVDSNFPDISPEITEESQSSAVRQDMEPDLSIPDPDPSAAPKLPSQVLETISPSLGVKKGSKGNREEIKFDHAWLSQLSNHEQIGLLQIIVNEGRGTLNQRSVIKGCLDGQSDSKNDPSIHDCLKAMTTPLGKLRPPSREDLEFPKSGVGTQCDINFSNQLALHNSALLKCYSLCDPRVRQMVLFVKAWTKIRKINSPYHGTLNSYGYVLMVLHFLMNVAQPPVLPNLQLATDMIEQDPISSRESTLDGHNIRFFRNEAAIEEMARKGEFLHNQESLGSLLRGFFQFYAYPPFGTFSWKDDVLSLRTRGGILRKVGKGWTGAKVEMVGMAGPGSDQKKVSHRYVVAIEDPFETEHNVARTVVFNGVVAIRDEFRRAADLISHGGIDPRLGRQDFFAEGKKKEHLQRRYDAPHMNAAPKKNAPSAYRVAKEPTLIKEAATHTDQSTKVNSSTHVVVTSAPDGKSNEPSTTSLPSLHSS